jgi:rhamnosyltransferase
VGAVIVYFNPDPSLIQGQLEALAAAGVERVAIVDNSPQGNRATIEHLRRDFVECSYEELGENRGLAAAQNVGVRRLLDRVEYILLLDQDSIPTEGMVQALREEADELLALGVSVAVIGPTPINRATGRPYRPRIPRREVLLPNGKTLKRGEIISSGSLIPCAAFREVGLFDEDLFIDGVDHEWCWRAARLHGRVVGVSARATLSHMVGEGDRRLLGFTVKIPTPFRTYYQVRNYFYLVGRSYVPLYWKASNLLKYCVKFVYFSSSGESRRAFFSNMTRGARDGIRHVLVGPELGGRPVVGSQRRS